VVETRNTRKPSCELIGYILFPRGSEQSGARCCYTASIPQEYSWEMNDQTPVAVAADDLQIGLPCTGRIDYPVRAFIADR
jgi:hypothetical protein